MSTGSNQASRRLSGVALGAMVALVAAATLVPSVASALATSALPPSESAPQQQQQAKGYWTRSRLESARPYPLPKVRATGGPVGGISTQTGGQPHAVQGKLPRSAQQQSAAAATPQGARSQAAVEPALYSYPFPFTRYYVDVQLYNAPATPGVYPYIAVGKIFFTQNGPNFVCSGASVASPAATQTVWTAGHCLNDGSNTFNTNTVFVPSYRNGVAPYGLFPATFLVVHARWNANGRLHARPGCVPGRPQRCRPDAPEPGRQPGVRLEPAADPALQRLRVPAGRALQRRMDDHLPGIACL